MASCDEVQPSELFPYAGGWTDWNYSARVTGNVIEIFDVPWGDVEDSDPIARGMISSNKIANVKGEDDDFKYTGTVKITSDVVQTVNDPDDSSNNEWEVDIEIEIAAEDKDDNTITPMSHSNTFMRFGWM